MNTCVCGLGHVLKKLLKRHAQPQRLAGVGILDLYIYKGIVQSR